MKSKRQTTRAKLDRERKLQEKRELKREKKAAAAAARREGEAAGDDPTRGVPSDPWHTTTSSRSGSAA